MERALIAILAGIAGWWIARRMNRRDRFPVVFFHVPDKVERPVSRINNPQRIDASWYESWADGKN